LRDWFVVRRQGSYLQETTVLAMARSEASNWSPVAAS